MIYIYIYLYMHTRIHQVTSIQAYVYLNRCTCTNPIFDEMCQTKIRFIVCYEVTFIYIYTESFFSVKCITPRIEDS